MASLLYKLHEMKNEIDKDIKFLDYDTNNKLINFDWWTFDNLPLLHKWLKYFNDKYITYNEFISEESKIMIEKDRKIFCGEFGLYSPTEEYLFLYRMSEVARMKDNTINVDLLNICNTIIIDSKTCLSSIEMNQLKDNFMQIFIYEKYMPLIVDFLRLVGEFSTEDIYKLKCVLIGKTCHEMDSGKFWKFNKIQEIRNTIEERKRIEGYNPTYGGW
uniref:Uncharacterized protein n=1 Tax=viral metagenome TaxID=1070528 RepID=A0A6C0EDE3_9ZZZZ